MNNNLNEVIRIKEYIEKSGLPLEIEITSILREHNWTVNNQAYFYDEDEKKARNIDMFAFKRIDLKTSPDFDRYHISLVIECKKSTNPWLFYTTTMIKEKLSYLIWVKNWMNPRDLIDFRKKELRLTKFLNYFNPKIIKMGVIKDVAFSRQDMIFDASCKVLKALDYERKLFHNLLSKLPSNPYGIIYPIIVLDGYIYEVQVTGDSTEVSPVQYLPYHVYGVSNIEERFLIDVVQKDYFKDYLIILDKEIDEIQKIF